MKTLILTNYASPYRIEFFNELGKFCDLTVLFTEKAKEQKHRSQEWFSDNNNANFKYIQLVRKLGLKNKSICLDIFKYLNRSYDRIIICGYSSLTTMSAIQYLKLKKIPFYIEVDGGLIKQDSLLKYKIKKYFLSSAIGWFSSGKETTKYLVHYGADKNKIIEYPFTSLKEQDILKQIPTEQEKLNLRKELNLKEEKIILSVGQFIYRKGYDILIKSMQSIDKNIGVYIIGDTPTEEYLNLQKQFNLTNLHFVGFKIKEELKKYYMIADLFVLPTREDIWGLVINEAMAMGLPIITTDKCVSGLELVENGVNGYIVPTENSEILAGKINKIFNENYKQMGYNSLNKIKNYTIRNMTKRHLEIMQNE